MIASYAFADAHPFSLKNLPTPGRRVVSVEENGQHSPFSAEGVARFVTLYGPSTTCRWAYAKPCECAGCTWTPPDEGAR